MTGSAEGLQARLEFKEGRGLAKSNKFKAGLCHGGIRGIPTSMAMWNNAWWPIGG